MLFRFTTPHYGLAVLALSFLGAAGAQEKATTVVPDRFDVR